MNEAYPYHINKHGEPDRCRAETRICPLGNGAHYKSKEDAYEALLNGTAVLPSHPKVEGKGHTMESLSYHADNNVFHMQTRSDYPTLPQGHFVLQSSIDGRKGWYLMEGMFGSSSAKVVGHLEAVSTKSISDRKAYLGSSLKGGDEVAANTPSELIKAYQTKLRQEETASMFVSTPKQLTADLDAAAKLAKPHGRLPEGQSYEEFSQDVRAYTLIAVANDPQNKADYLAAANKVTIVSGKVTDYLSTSYKNEIEGVKESVSISTRTAKNSADKIQKIVAVLDDEAREYRRLTQRNASKAASGQYSEEDTKLLAMQSTICRAVAISVEKERAKAADELAQEQAKSNAVRGFFADVNNNDFKLVPGIKEPTPTNDFLSKTQ